MPWTWWNEWSAWWASLAPGFLFLLALPVVVALAGWIGERRRQP